MLLTRTYNNTTNNYHYGHYMPHKTTSNKTSNVQLMDHPNIPPYLLAMAKNSQIVQHEKESERVNAFQKLTIQTPTTTLQTNYSSSSLNVLAQSPCSPSSMLDSSPTPNTKSDSKSVKRFIAHSQTHNLIQRNDLVFINIDEELSILNMIDPLFHGKIGIISEIREDDCVIEVVENNQKNNDDNMCFMNMTVNQPISHSFQPQSMLRKELNKSSRPSVRPLKRKIVVPIFCLCLEDAVLKERLANNNGYQR
ncbi:predicted protein [Naegleria gruberi]|uniref:Predicted protein n=1 Tax=Naegleria gruberi TaxID=5762 RepID=D2VG14_NAEGR|nr:uncharacterized protein NAEGRDRAFT_67818 [Naegleria gruberi]EFC44184.1 predicted protein [Naegleria gruberi]|eukprot:XP_002676928.1 predicted protein [Naegleria gruberi strain NEG-M]